MDAKEPAPEQQSKATSSTWFGSSLSEAQWREIREIAQLGFWELDLSTGALHWCEMIYRIFGIDRERFGASYDAFLAAVHPNDRDYVDSAYRSSVRDHVPYDIVHRLLRDDGEVRWVNERGRTQYDDDGRPMRSFGTVVDITPIKRLEEQLRQAQKMESLGLLTGGLVHDINNFLTVIQGGTAILIADPTMPTHGLDRLREVEAACRSCAALTRQLLAFSRNQPLDRQVVDLGAALQAMLPMLQASVGTRVRVEFADHADGAKARIDLGQLTQVMLNLALNARDAMAAGGNLAVTLTRAHTTPDELELAVTDSGAGMTPEVAARIFEPFFTTKIDGSGTGLGLGVVEGIVEQHGGRIDVESTVGVGTTFRVQLPEWREQGPAFTLPRPERRAPTVGTILVVDGSPQVRSIVRDTLGPLGYEVVAAADADEALALDDSLPQPPDLVIAELDMPRRSGRELADALRRRRPRQAVLFLGQFDRTGVPLPPPVSSTGRADLCVPKPFVPSGLASAVLRALRPDDSG